jgi:hypothetical protein
VTNDYRQHGMLFISTTTSVVTIRPGCRNMHLLCFYVWPPTKHPPTISVRTPCGRTNSLQFMPKVHTMPPCSTLLETSKPVEDIRPSLIMFVTMVNLASFVQDIYSCLPLVTNGSEQPCDVSRCHFPTKLR